MDQEDFVLEGWIPGVVFEVSTVQQIRDMASDNADRKVMLMCKSKSCRPCKAFSVQYNRLAAQHTDIVFLSVTGEASPELRKLMIGLEIRNTPTFVGFWKKAIVHRHSGISKERMEAALASDWQQLADGLQEKDPGDALLF
jgi:thiol-disulfide isomerase/thioredoxin